jgi:aryl-alcohol dehydrogenase-like predicted oxidoreductase
MEYRYLGKSGLQVSAIGLGGNTFGRTGMGPEETRRIIERALELGVNFIDSADIYNGGKSEELLGPVVADHRREIVLATKFGVRTGEGPNRAGASRAYIHAAVDASLRRLGTDYIDLYQVHQPDPRTPIEETLRALDDLVRAGKVRYIGASNSAGWQVADAAWTARAGHLTPLISEQPEYSLLKRDIEAELVPACLKFGVGLITWGPLAGGFLTGKYRRGEPLPPGTRLAGRTVYTKYLTDASFDLLERLEAFANERDHPVRELAIAWLLRRPAVSTIIIGAMRPEQLEENVRAAEWVLSDADMQELESGR